MELVQLSLWPNEDGSIRVRCVHCGWKFDALPQLEQHHAEMHQFIMEHPLVRTLPSRTRAFLEAVLPVLVAGRAGVAEMSREAECSASGAYRQLKNLVRRGVLLPVPKRNDGVYNQYELLLLNSNENAQKARKSIDSPVLN